MGTNWDMITQQYADDSRCNELVDEARRREQQPKAISFDQFDVSHGMKYKWSQKI